VLFKFTINKIAASAYIPRQVIAQGFHGEVNLVVGALTAVIVKPGTSKEKAIESLELIIANLKLSEGWEEPVAPLEPAEEPTP
jgi:hypothetical protein